MRTQFWFFGDHGRIDVRDAEGMFDQQFTDALQKAQAGSALPFRVGIWEMRADVAESGRAEQRVADRVCQRIAIGVSHGAQMKWEFDTAEDELAAFGEAMKIVSNTRPGHRAARSSRR